MALHPVDIALQRVDLAIMRQHPERLRQPPLRERVRRIPLVINRKRTLEPVIQQIRIKLRHLLGQHHALVDDRPAGQRRNVKLPNPLRMRCLLDPAPDHVKLPLKRLLINTLGIRNQNLLNLGPGRIGLLAQHIHVHRHMPPTVNVIPHPQDLGLHNRPAGLLRAKISPRQKHLTHRNHLTGVRLMPGPLNLVIEKRHRDLYVNARTIAGLAIGIHRATVPNSLQRLDPVLDHRTRLAAIHIHDQANATRGVLIFRLIETVFRHPLALCLFGTDPVRVVSGHG